MNRKTKFIDAYTWMYGGTKKEAEMVYKTAGKEYIDMIIDGFKENAKQGFYND